MGSEGGFVWPRTIQTSGAVFRCNWIGMKFYSSRRTREEITLDHDMDFQLNLHINSASLPSMNPTKHESAEAVKPSSWKEVCERG